MPLLPRGALDLTGVQFSRLTALEPRPGRRWLCRCECGREAVVQTGKLRARITKSCGCYKSDRQRLKYVHKPCSNCAVVARLWRGRCNPCWAFLNNNGRERPRHLIQRKAMLKVGLKHCFRCKQFRPTGEFLRMGLNALQSECRACHLMRASDRRAKVKLGERVYRSKVYERDGWICQVCGLLVDPALRHPNRMAASLDHRVPLARGGTHTFANCQLAHFSCNARKGARVAA